MNILLINIGNLGPNKTPGGAEKVLLEIVDNLKNKGFNFTVLLSNGDPTKEEFCRIGADVYIKSFRSLSAFIYLPYVASLIKKKKIDLIQTNECRGNLFGSIAGILTGVPVIACRQELYFTPFIKGKLALKRKVYRFIDKLLFNLINKKLIVVSNAIKKEIIGSQKVNPDKIEVITFGLNPDKFVKISPNIEKLREEFNLKKGTVVVITVANISREKGYDILIEAASQIRKVVPFIHFICFGEGEYRFKAESKIRKLDLQDVFTLAGFRNNVLDYLKLADLFVLPSLAEGASKSLMEAMLMKKPVIGSNVGGIPEIVKDGYNGILVPPGNVECLIEAILMLIDDKSKAERLSEEGYKTVINQFNLKKAINKVESVYNLFS